MSNKQFVQAINSMVQMGYTVSIGIGGDGYIMAQCARNIGDDLESYEASGPNTGYAVWQLARKAGA